MPVEISDWNDLQNVDNDLTGDYVLVNDLDENTEGYSGTGDDFDPIGFIEGERFTSEFTGSFDGDGFVIEDLVIETADAGDIALIASTDSGATIENLSVSGSVTNTGNGEFCFSGLVGNIQGGIVKNCVSHVDVTSDGDQVGCLAGNNNTGTIENCYSSGSVDGADTVGGLVGQTGSEISTSYAVGSVSGTNEVGGLIGSTFDDPTIIDSYWDTEATGQSTSAGGTGLTTSEMQGSEAETNMTGFDFTDIWDTVLESDDDADRDGYPILLSINRESQLTAQGIVEPFALSVQTNRADLVSATSATLNGEITELEDGESADVFFEYGTNVEDNETTKTTLSDTVAFDETVENLPDTVIEFRALAEGEVDGETFTETGQTLTFETFKKWKGLIDGTELKTF